MKNRLQLRHSDQLFETKGDVIQYLQDQMIFEPGKQALFAEPLVFKYGNEDNPNIILAIGSYGIGENDNKNKYFIIDTASIEADVKYLKDIFGDKDSEIEKIKEDIEALKTKDTELSKVIGDVGAALQYEIDRAKEAEKKNADDIALNAESIEAEKNRSIEKDNEHDAKIEENKVAINEESERAKAVENAITVHPQDSTTIRLSKSESTTGTSLYGELKISQQKGQQLKVISSNGGDTEGLYFNAVLNYDSNSGALSLIVNDNVVSTFNLPLEQFLDSELTHYDPETKKIILVFREQGKDLKYVEIPIGNLVDSYMAGDGLKLSNNTFSIKINQNASEDFIVVDSDGIALKGIENKINEIVSVEQQRAETAEESLNTKLDDEIKRASDSENSLLSTIQAEATRAQSAEAQLQANLDKEVVRASNAENVLQNNIDATKTELQSNIDTVEKTLTQRLDANVLNINELNSKIVSEIERATNAENTLTSSLNEAKESLAQESERAQGAEAQITTNYIAADAEILRQSTDYTNNKFNEESNRAQAAEKLLNDIIGSEFSTANTITAKLAEEINNRKDNDAALRIDISALSGNSATKTALQQEIDNRILKDSELENKINTNISSISDISNNIRTYNIKKIIPGDTGTTASYELVDDKGIRCGEVINIPLDQILEQAEYDSLSKKLILTFRVGTGSTKTEIDVADLIDEYVAGNGININGNSISIKVDSSSEAFLSLSDSGLKISGVQNAIDSGITAERQRAETAEQSISANVQELKSKVDLSATQEQLEAEVERAKAGEIIEPDNLNKTVEINVSPRVGGGNILTTKIKTASYDYTLPSSDESSNYSLLGKLPDGTLFAINTTNAMRHKLTGNDYFSSLEDVINSLKYQLDQTESSVDSIKEIANNALTIANNSLNIANSAMTVAQQAKNELDDLNSNFDTKLKDALIALLGDTTITDQIVNIAKDAIISNNVFKQKVDGDTDVEVVVDEGRTVTIGLADNCTIASIDYSE